MRNLLILTGLIVILISCGGSKTETAIEDIPGKDLIVKITDLEESFHQKIANLEIGQNLPEEEQMKLVRLLKEYADTYPESLLAPEYLDKIHMIFSGMRKYELSVAYADSVLIKYDDYVNRVMVIESIAIAYDYDIKPRDTSMVKKYYAMFLEENDQLAPEQRKSIQEKINNPSNSLEDQIQAIIAAEEN